ncbi:T9SS type A sorting domain-containing protein [Flavisolibacter tropicus]|uniref:Secretion system C-terminal sorting domain-containing protein n=1 Tax=Flavisolibacter tropicus TaxID=1492898 RepID=A0A172U0R6_9BACT|nr:T9SS type A sorting domain-containing protein [Flavisolibacter tropicus]ANE52910.1 hypothetical protein SY85_22945 [Flavisolibacter tropicus]
MHKFTLSIPTPCHENWDQMTPVEKGRFCASCQKTVIDFTNMTDQQLAAYFKKPTGSVCGRFVKDQLERNITVPTKRIPWLRYFFQFTLPAFLFSLKATGQKVERVEKISIVHSKTDSPINKLSQEVTRDKLQYDTVRNDMALTSALQGIAGGVMVIHNPKRTKKAIPLISNAKQDTAFNQFSVYPNPARSNGTVTIDCKKLARGAYSMQIVAIEGRPVYTKQLELEQKGGLLRTELPALTPGQYVITLTSIDSKKVFTEKIQVL